MRRREFIASAGTAVMWPLAASAQQPGKSYRLGYLALLPGEDETLVKPFLQRLRELGYREGDNLRLEYRSAEGRPERLAGLAVELAQANLDVLVAGFGTLAPKAAAAATKTTPIVFTNVGDPVGAGLVASLARPGANVTGLSAQATNIAAKRLQILEDIVPGRLTIAILLNPDTPFSAIALREVMSTAERRTWPVRVFEARTLDEVGLSVEAAIRSGAAGLLVLEDPLILGVKQEVVDLVAAARLPAIYGVRAFVEAGGLVSYGVDQRQSSRLAADYVDKVLKGARPSDLPVQQPTKFELILNGKTAKALGIDFPTALLASADEVIE